jgi:predicted  nucleic acid-binding Zn-ribbon protein
MTTQFTKAGVPLLFAISSLIAAGCGGVSEMTKDRVARSDTALKQATQTIGNSEAGAVELQAAREHMEQAQKALSDNKEEPAVRHAQQAELTAELAVAKSQSASAQRAAEELQASIRTLREEAERGSTTATDTP